jgi:hypothetical protein
MYLECQFRHDRKHSHLIITPSRAVRSSRNPRHSRMDFTVTSRGTMSTKARVNPAWRRHVPNVVFEPEADPRRDQTPEPPGDSQKTQTSPPLHHSKRTKEKWSWALNCSCIQSTDGSLDDSDDIWMDIRRSIELTADPRETQRETGGKWCG